ncbi:MAG: tRNA-dihydrouridine synthase, partial [Desulfobacteraceae bacterium]|nr:tRNA-dihydrouridine synthase [Desulfobacteraceae bacterium]
IQNVSQGLLMLEETGCDAVMIGRAALRNPFIFSQVESLLENRKSSKKYDKICNDDMFNIMKKLVMYYSEYYDDQHASRMLRGRLPWFIKGAPGASNFRKKVSQINSCSRAIELIDEFSKSLANSECYDFL